MSEAVKTHSNKIKTSTGRKVFMVVNALVLTFVCLTIVIPLWNIIITSLAEDKDVMGKVYLLWPKSFTLVNYDRVLRSGYFDAFCNSLFVAAVGTALSLALTVPLAFALSRKDLVFRRFFMGLVVGTMLFDAGMIPFYVVVKSLGLIDSLASLIIPMALSTFNVIVMKNFMSAIPASLIESAQLDGCSEIGAMWRIVIPLSIPIIAAVTLFYFVQYWNRYFVVVMFINDSHKYTLQVVLRTLMFESDSTISATAVYDNLKMTVMIMGMLPVLVLYPFIQRYFVSGLMLGSIKE